MPIYLPTTPKVQNAKFANKPIDVKPKVMYFPTCNNRIFGDTSDSGTTNALQKLINKLGYDIIYPKNLNNLCCGQLFSSKNDEVGCNIKSEELKNAIGNNICIIHCLNTVIHEVLVREIGRLV